MSESARKSSHQTNLNCDNVWQQIQVKKQKFQCIINLNTTFCTNKSKHKKKCTRKRSQHRKKKEYSNEEAEIEKEEHRNNKPDKQKGEHGDKKDHNIKIGKHQHEKEHRYKELESEHPAPNLSTKHRTVPKCSRKACWYHYNRRNEISRIYNRQMPTNLHGERNKDIYKVKSEDQKTLKHHHHHHHKCKHSREKIKQTESRILLSPISSSPLDDHSITYEDISNTSFGKYIQEVPMAYKRHRRPHAHNHVRQHRHKEDEQESKLDTLIRRTKERERKVVEQSRREPKPRTSTPIHIEYSSLDVEMSCSDMDISFTSLSTLVIGANIHHNAYSPSCPIEEVTTREDFQNYEEKLVWRGYSPSSPTRDYTSKVPQKTDYKLIKVKNEPLVDIEAYSPTSTPKIDCTEKTIKREIQFKTEPLFTCDISPIYVDEMHDIGSEFCKIESVKSEFIDDYDC